MSKKIYIDMQDISCKWREMIVLDEDKLVTEYCIFDSIYVNRKNVRDLEKYLLAFDDDAYITKDIANDYLACPLENIPNKIRDCIMYFSGCSEMCNISQDELQSFFKTIKAKSHSASYNACEKVWYYSNKHRIVLESELYYVQYVDYTDEFSNMREIDSQQHSMGQYTLYELPNKNKAKVLIDHPTLYKNTFSSISFLENNEIQTIEQALKKLKM